MPRQNLTELSPTASLNTDFNGVSVAEGMQPGNVNDAMRELAAMLGDAFALASPGTKLTAVKAINFIVADDADKITVGTTNATEISHDNTAGTTTLDAAKNLTIEVGTQTDPATFKIDGFDATAGKKTIVQVGTDNGITLGDSTVSPTNAVTVNGRVSATSFVGDGSGLTNIGTTEGAFPVGGIVMWSGTLATIPTGWVLCDGTTQNSVVTPDLREKFVMGSAASTNPGTTGGANSLSLVTANLPSHTHGVGTIGSGHTHSFSGSNTHDHGDGNLSVSSHSHSISGTSHSHSVNYNTSTIYLPTSGSATTVVTSVGSGSNSGSTGSANGANSSTGNSSPSISGDTSNASISVSGTTGSASMSGTSASTGSGTAFDNRPAFYEIAYIMYVGS
jgi:hypothetical protein